MIDAVPTQHVGPTAPAISVAAMRGTRRVVLIFSPDGADPMLAAQRAILGAAGAGLADRDVTVVTIVGDRVQGARDDAVTLRARYHMPSGLFGFLLIGKDGHVADREERVVPASALFARIDAMPMRRDEARARR